MLARTMEYCLVERWVELLAVQLELLLVEQLDNMKVHLLVGQLVARSGAKWAVSLVDWKVE